MSANNMKTLALMAFCLAGSATAAISMTVRYTDNMIDGMCDASSSPPPQELQDN